VTVVTLPDPELVLELVLEKLANPVIIDAPFPIGNPCPLAIIGSPTIQQPNTICFNFILLFLDELKDKNIYRLDSTKVNNLTVLYNYFGNKSY
jgi:hypothetical protein